MCPARHPGLGDQHMGGEQGSGAVKLLGMGVSDKEESEGPEPLHELHPPPGSADRIAPPVVFVVTVIVSDLPPPLILPALWPLSWPVTLSAGGGERNQLSTILVQKGSILPAEAKSVGHQ